MIFTVIIALEFDGLFGVHGYDFFPSGPNCLR